MARVLVRDGRVVTRDGRVVTTDDPTGCGCCGGECSEVGETAQFPGPFPACIQVAMQVVEVSPGCEGNPDDGFGTPLVSDVTPQSQIVTLWPDPRLEDFDPSFRPWTVGYRSLWSVRSFTLSDCQIESPVTWDGGLERVSCAIGCVFNPVTGLYEFGVLPDSPDVTFSAFDQYGRACPSNTTKAWATAGNYTIESAPERLAIRENDLALGSAVRTGVNRQEIQFRFSWQRVECGPRPFGSCCYQTSDGRALCFDDDTELECGCVPIPGTSPPEASEWFQGERCAEIDCEPDPRPAWALGSRQLQAIAR